MFEFFMTCSFSNHRDIDGDRPVGLIETLEIRKLIHSRYFQKDYLSISKSMSHWGILCDIQQ